MENNNTSVVIKSPQGNDHSSSEIVVSKNFQELYLKKEYKDAASYLIQNKQQLSSGIFHYNLGTVYVKLGDLPAARYHLEKAVKSGYINSASLNNLIYIKTQLQVDDLSTSTTIQDQLADKISDVPQSAFLSLSLLLVLISLMTIKSRLVVKKMNIALVLLLAISPIAISELYIEKMNVGIALKEIPVFEGPSKIFSEKGKVRAGSKIILGEYKDGWFFIKYPISLTGWINKDRIGLY